MHENKEGSLKGTLLLIMFGLLILIAAGCAPQNQDQQKEQNTQQGTQGPIAQTGDRANNSHSKMGISCEQCHVTKGEPVTRQECQSCHTSMEDLIAKTKDMDPNPHGPHHYDLEDCSICHSVHDKSQMMCAQCHDFTWIKNLGDEWEVVEDPKQ